MTTIDPSYYLKNQTSDRAPSPDLGKDEFLKILMTQLQNQDPSNPMEDKEFISQMASFSSLEQTMNMASSLDELVKNQSVSPIIQNSHMIGKDVAYQAYDKDTGEKLDVENSRVVSVSQHEGNAVLGLENGEEIYAESILQISAPGVDEDPSEAADPEGSE